MSRVPRPVRALLAVGGVLALLVALRLAAGFLRALVHLLTWDPYDDGPYVGITKVAKDDGTYLWITRSNT